MTMLKRGVSGVKNLGLGFCGVGYCVFCMVIRLTGSDVEECCRCDRFII